MVWSQGAPGDPGVHRWLAPGVDAKRGRRRCRSVCPCGGEAPWVWVSIWWALGPEGCAFLAQVLWVFVCLGFGSGLGPSFNKNNLEKKKTNFIS